MKKEFEAWGKKTFPGWHHDGLEGYKEQLEVAFLAGRNSLESVELLRKAYGWRGLDGDGISDPIRQEIYDFLKEE